MAEEPEHHHAMTEKLLKATLNPSNNNTNVEIFLNHNFQGEIKIWNPISTTKKVI